MALPVELGARGMLGSWTATALKLITFAPTWAEITIQQPGARSRKKGGGGADIGDLGLVVVKVPGGDVDRCDRWSLAGDCRRTLESFGSCEVHLTHDAGAEDESTYLAFPTFGFNRAVEGEAAQYAAGGGASTEISAFQHSGSLLLRRLLCRRG